MLTVDRRELIVMRREEANACIHYGLHHAATLTACSGIEMLLKTLYDELLEKLLRDDPTLAQQMQNYRNEMTGSGEPGNEWGLGRWITFYKDFNVFSELRNQFAYDFSEFKLQTLWHANSEWNKCKHSALEASPVTARLICNYLNTYLEETRHPIGGDNTHLKTMGEFGEKWRQQWKTSITRWVVQHRSAPQAELLLPLVELLGLVVDLIGDERVPIGSKTHLMVAANYVFSSVDLMPEHDSDVGGLVDDAAVLVLTLYWLLNVRDLEEDTLRHHWQGDTDIVSEIDRLEAYIRENNELLFLDTRIQLGDNLIWATIRRVATEGPEALWQNYWKEAY